MIGLHLKPFFTVVWVGPWSCVGKLLGIVTILTGEGLHWLGRVLEFNGGPVIDLFEMVLIHGEASAVTLEHTIFGRERLDLQRHRR